MRLGLRTTLLLGYGFVVAFMGAFAIFTGLSFISDTVVTEAKLRVQMDLNSAWSGYDEEKAILQSSISIVAQREDIHKVLGNKIKSHSISPELDSLKKVFNLDFLLLLDTHGKIISKSVAPVGIRSFSDNSIVQQALVGKFSSGTVLHSRNELLKMDPDLAEKAYIPLLQTERARPTEKQIEDQGMTIEAATPVFGPGNEIYGIVYGGILLNRRFDLVDRIRRSVFDIENYEGKPLGTVTIFLWDTRVATNVIKADTTRAIGTRVSEEVYKKVLEKGERFGDRAFVVNDWYLSAYDPIIDPDGKIIGIFYVGLLEQKYLDYKAELTLKFLGMGFIALLLVAQFAIIFAGKIRKPIEHLKEATRKISGGDLNTRVREDEGSRDIRELGHSFNLMAASLESPEQRIGECHT